jgi:hypothetical protein
LTLTLTPSSSNLALSAPTKFTVDCYYQGLGILMRNKSFLAAMCGGFARRKLNITLPTLLSFLAFGLNPLFFKSENSLQSRCLAPSQVPCNQESFYLLSDLCDTVTWAYSLFIQFPCFVLLKTGLSSSLSSCILPDIHKKRPYAPVLSLLLSKVIS